jgi:hypothetical protein
MELFDWQKLHIFGFLGGRGGLKRPRFQKKGVFSGFGRFVAKKPDLSF